MRSKGSRTLNLDALETPVLNCAFDFTEIDSRRPNELETEIIEQLNDNMYIYRLSSLILRYLLKIYCYNNNDMYFRDNLVVQNAFGIVDTVRRKIGGEKFYLLPYDKNSTIDNLMRLQFGNVLHVYNYYYDTERVDGCKLLCSHDY